MPLTLEDIGKLGSIDKLYGMSVYAVANRGVFGFRVYTGIITGVQFTSDKPKFYVKGGGDKGFEGGWFTEVTDSKDEMLEMIETPNLRHLAAQHLDKGIKWPEKSKEEE